MDCGTALEVGMAKMDTEIRIAAFRNDFLNAVIVHLRSISCNLSSDAGKISANSAIVNRRKRSLFCRRGFLKEAMRKEWTGAIGSGMPGVPLGKKGPASSYYLRGQKSL
jgi:hypothetical protein